MAGTYTKEKGIENMLYNGDLESEDAIMNDKERFGRVRTILMKQLRAKYGDDIANRALYSSPFGSIFSIPFSLV